jgi:hypothetical protein
MYKKIFSFLLVGLFLAGCSRTVTQPATQLSAPTVSSVEAATQPLPTPTAVPSATTAATLPPTPDFSLIGLPTEQAGGTIFDFVAQMCDAQWFTRGQQLPCPGNADESSAGYVMQLDGASQGLPSNMNVLLAYTPQDKYQTISSKYPSFTVQKGDRFRAVLACRSHSFCDVDFVLDFANDKGSAGLTHWRYIFTDTPVTVDYSLDALAGQTVQFDLAVRANANPSDAYAVWIAPHIYRPAP